MKVGSKIFNAFWIVLVGIWSAISNAILGVACCCTLIGIPFGLQYFKFIKLAFAPAGKRVINRYGKHPFMNTVWLILGGIEMYLVYLIIGALCCVTVVGIPLGKQLFKIATYNLGPFGAEIIEDGEYTSTKDTAYDAELLTKRILSNPDVDTGHKNADGSSVTVRQVLASKRYQFMPSLEVGTAAWRREYKGKNFLSTIILIVLMGVGIYAAVQFALKYGQTISSDQMGIYVVIGSLLFGVVVVLFSFLFAPSTNRITNRTYKAELLKCISDLYVYYPNGSVVDKKYESSKNEEMQNPIEAIFNLIPWGWKYDCID